MRFTLRRVKTKYSPKNRIDYLVRHLGEAKAKEADTDLLMKLTYYTAAPVLAPASVSEANGTANSWPIRIRESVICMIYKYLH